DARRQHASSPDAHTATPILVLEPAKRVKRKVQRNGFRRDRSTILKGLAVGVDRTGCCRESVPRVKRRKRRNGFWQSGADGETRYTLESAAARYCIRCKPTHPSPSAHEFRLLLNGLAAPLR